MPEHAKITPQCAGFWLRYFASLLLLAGMCYCAAMAVNSAELAALILSPDREADLSAPATVRAAAIILDPGHGGIDPGTVAFGQFEKTWTLKVAEALARELRSRGWSVELTRNDDSAVTLVDRSSRANRHPRRAFVSIHFNSGGPDAAGIETYYAWPKNPEIMARTNLSETIPAGMVARDDRGRLLAEVMQASVCAATGAKNRGAHNAPGYLVLNRSECPSVLVECGFLTNAAECRDIQSEAWRLKLVRGLAGGLESWLRSSSTPGYGIVMEQVADALPVSR